MPLLEVKNLKKVYTTRFGGAQVQALSAVNFSVERGEYVAIMGESGSGKTTLLNIIASLDKPTAGKVLLAGEDVTSIAEKQLSVFRRKKLGFVFQDFNLMDNLSVEENIMIPMVLNKTKYRDMRAVVDRNADLLEISGLLKKYPYELSGGEKQRVAIARALSNEPDIILADEATGNLDTVSAKKIMDYFAEINGRKKKAVVVVTHDPVVASYARKILFIKDGKIMKQMENQSKQQESIRIISDAMLDL